MGEYIEREALMEYADSQPGGLISNKSIQFFPAADVAPVQHGQWEWDQRAAEWGYPYLCSQCGKAHDHEEPYCPNCGAKMDLED